MYIKLEDFCTISEYAKIKDFTTTWVHILIKRGCIEYIQMGKRNLLPKSGKMPDYISNQSLIKEDL